MLPFITSSNAISHSTLGMYRGVVIVVQNNNDIQQVIHHNPKLHLAIGSEVIIWRSHRDVGFRQTSEVDCGGVAA